MSGNNNPEDDAAFLAWRKTRVTPDPYSAWYGGLEYARSQIKELEAKLAKAEADLAARSAHNSIHYEY